MESSTMVNWEQKMEQEWGRAFVHESGHALMAVLQEILCHGIYYQRTEKGGKFCTLIPPKAASERAKKDYLFLAAGAAAETLVYGNHDEDAAGADKRDFDQPNSPAFEESLKEASELLYNKRRHLKRLVSMLKATVRKVDYDMRRLTELGMDGSDQRYSMLLSKEELGNAVDRP
jgi:hypothetical protein